MTCPFCGAREVDRMYFMSRFECGSKLRDTGEKEQSDTCRELCQLREENASLKRQIAEMRAKSLEWEEKLGGKMLEAKSLSGQMQVMIFQRYEPSLVAHIGFETIKRSFANIEAAKAYAEELHQQEWAKLMEWRREI